MPDLLVFVDTETGGLEPETNEILSIGIQIADAKTYAPLEAKEWFITPERPELMHPKALEVNGYTPEKWAAAGAKPAAEVFKEIPRWLRRGTFAGHNCPFDIGFVWETAKRLGVVGFPGKPFRYLDSMQWAHLLRNDGLIPNVKLDSLCAYYNLPRSQYHGALEDADLSRRAAKAIQEQFRRGVVAP